MLGLKLIHVSKRGHSQDILKHGNDQGDFIFSRINATKFNKLLTTSHKRVVNNIEACF